MVQDQLNPDLKIAGTLFNRCSGRDEVDRFFSEEDGNQIPNKTFMTTIPEDETIRKSHSLGKPVALCNIMATSAQAYFDSSVELMQAVS